LFDIIALKEVPNLDQQKRIGFVFPIYAWGIAEPMLTFAKKLPQTNAFTYGVCTCGADAGVAKKKLSKLYQLESCYSVAMPSNYIVGSDVEDEGIIHKKIADAKIESQRIASEILQSEKVYRVNEGSLALLKSNLACMGFNKFGRNTKPFYATEQCNGCGLCAKNCPMSTIILVDGKRFGVKNVINACAASMNVHKGLFSTEKQR